MDEKIKPRELVEVRKQEMESMLPGFMTEIEVNNKPVRVYSPTPQQRATYKSAE